MNATIADPRSTRVRSATGASRMEIEAKAMEVLRDSGIPLTPPINLQALAEVRQVKVYKAKFADPQISGMISLDAKYNPAGVAAGERGTIYLNSTDYPSRQSFTLAHELGHLELGHYDNTAGFHAESVKFRAGGQPYDPIEEREANQFAAALLMPAELFKGAMEVTGGELAEVAVMFGVSVQAATIRATELQLMPDWSSKQR